MGKQAVLIDLTGKQFGYWEVIKRAPNDKYNQSMWVCRCKCGNEKVVRGNDLRRGKSTSCGCFRSDFVSKKFSKHKQTHTRLYGIWAAIKRRCFGKNTYYYKRYGGRGITVCDEWKNNFISFYNWSIKNGYKSNLSIDRIDNNGNYCPSNCRWATKERQQRNKSNNHIETFAGVDLCLADIAELTNNTFSAVQHRASRGTLYKLEQKFINDAPKDKLKRYLEAMHS